MPTFDEWLREGKKRHETAQWQEALYCYQQAYLLQSEHKELLGLIGCLYLDAGQPAESIPVLRLAIQKNPFWADGYLRLGTALQQQGEMTEAVTALQKAVRIKPRLTEAQYRLGLLLEAQGRNEEAADRYRLTLKHAPAHAEAQVRLDALRSAPAEVAETAPTRSARETAQSHLEFGQQMHAMSKLSAAVASYRMALQCDPNYVEVYDTLGKALWGLQRYEEAEEIFRELTARKPSEAEAYANLGAALHALGRIEAAVAPLQRAIELKPDHAQAHASLASVLYRFGNHEEAMAICLESLRYDPHYSYAHFLLGLLLLQRGDYAQGWREYEWRTQVPLYVRPPLTGPAWDGSPLDGKTILIYTEQGMGDVLQFARFVPLVKAAGGRVKVLCWRELANLFVGCEGVEAVYPLESKGALPAVAYDLQVSLISLPYLLNITQANLPARVPYFSLPAALRAAWQSQVAPNPPAQYPSPPNPLSRAAGEKSPSPPGPLSRAAGEGESNALSPLAPCGRGAGGEGFSGGLGGLGSELKIGLRWAGSKVYHRDWRSCALADFAPLAAIPGVRFFSLQVGAGAEEAANAPAGLNLIDLTSEIHDFTDTAALLLNLDLVISVDTSVAHLAGALGVPVWIPLDYGGDWRWQREGDTSPWYPTARLFRQPTLGDWEGVFARMAEALATLTQDKTTEAYVTRRPADTEASGDARSDAEIARAYCELGQQLQATGKLDTAAVSYRLATQRDPDYVEAYEALGKVLWTLNRHPEAEPAFREVAAAHSANAAAHANLGAVLYALGRFDETLAPLQRALELDPDSTQAQAILGAALYRLDRLEEAMAACRQTLVRDPNYPDAHFVIGMLLLERGDFAEGWREYEWRTRLPEYIRLPLTGSAWDGSPLDGKTILIYTEQGLGDSILFARFLPLVKATGVRVKLLCPRELVTLFSGCEGIDELIPLEPNSEIPTVTYDVHASLLSLPFLLRAETLPARVPYLSVDAERQAAWQSKVEPNPPTQCPSPPRPPSPTLRERGESNTDSSPFLVSGESNALSPLSHSVGEGPGVRGFSPPSLASGSERPGKGGGGLGELGSELRIGLRWAGSKVYRRDRRSCALADFAPLAAIPGVRFFSLQVGAGAEEAANAPAGLNLIDLTSEIHDFTDTAALLLNLDLVISVDTSVAHLAGALGVPVWIPLDHSGDWRWQREGDTTPWYPTARLFRQSNPGDWQSAMERIAVELQRLVAERTI